MKVCARISLFLLVLIITSVSSINTKTFSTLPGGTIPMCPTGPCKPALSMTAR
jgi:hypothetical protein